MLWKISFCRIAENHVTKNDHHFDDDDDEYDDVNDNDDVGDDHHGDDYDYLIFSSWRWSLLQL